MRIRWQVGFLASLAILVSTTPGESRPPGQTSVELLGMDGYAYKGTSVASRRLRLNDSNSDAVELSTVRISVEPFGQLVGKFRVTQEPSGGITALVLPNGSGGITAVPMLTFPLGAPVNAGVLLLYAGERVVVNCSVRVAVQSGFMTWELGGGGVCQDINGKGYQIFLGKGH